MARLLLVIGAAVLLGASACGDEPPPGSTPGEQGARDVAAAWYAAVANEDAASACRLMTTSMRSEVIDAAGTTTCEDGIHTYSNTLDEPTKDAMRAGGFTLTMKGSDYAHIDLNTSSSPTFGIGWRTDRWLLNHIVE